MWLVAYGAGILICVRILSYIVQGLVDVIVAIVFLTYFGQTFAAKGSAAIYTEPGRFFLRVVFALHNNTSLLFVS
jgi:hypothetical protein